MTAAVGAAPAVAASPRGPLRSGEAGADGSAFAAALEQVSAGEPGGTTSGGTTSGGTTSGGMGAPGSADETGNADGRAGSDEAAPAPRPPAVDAPIAPLGAATAIAPEAVTASTPAGDAALVAGGSSAASEPGSPGHGTRPSVSGTALASERGNAPTTVTAASATGMGQVTAAVTASGTGVVTAMTDTPDRGPRPPWPRAPRTAEHTPAAADVAEAPAAGTGPATGAGPAPGTAITAPAAASPGLDARPASSGAARPAEAAPAPADADAPAAGTVQATSAPPPGAPGLESATAPTADPRDLDPRPAASGARPALGEVAADSSSSPAASAVPPTAAAPGSASTGPAAPTQPAAAPPATQTTPSAMFAAQLSQPVLRLAHAPHGEHAITVHVAPEELGPVTVRAIVGTDGTRIEVAATGEAGREALRQVLGDLRRDLAASGLAATLDLGEGSGRGDAETGPGASAPAINRDDHRADASAPQPTRTPAAPTWKPTSTLDTFA